MAVFECANDTGGFLLGYRYNLNRWLSAEANYGYDRNTQFYFGGTDHFRNRWNVSPETVSYEFQGDGKQMMRLRPR